ncbi:MAG TPA: hypothetical protein VMI06_15040 [Terriglobia bacterium]|nr:hypothetical protein [Terriglobia bacterium]
MRSGKPPALAVWMLEHFMLGDKRESLVGDLLEESRRGRSARWFWSQVVGAIAASFLNQLRAHWLTLSSQLVFVAAWCWASPFSGLNRTVRKWFFSWFFTWAPNHQHWSWTVWLAWETALVVAVPLGLYLGATRKLSLRGFGRGLAAGWSLWVIAAVGGSELLGFYARYTHALSWGGRWPLWVLAQYIPLLIAIWVARSSKKSNRSSAPVSA